MIDFVTYVCQCGWSGTDDTDVPKLMASVWATPEYYGKFKTVENFLCSPYDAIQFCRDFELKASISATLDEFTVLKHLLNLRKQKFLVPYQREFDKDYR